MKASIFIVLITLCFSCTNRRSTDDKIIKNIINSNYTVFSNITLEPRGVNKDKLYNVPFVRINQNKQTYTLPNFEYYDCHNFSKSCLKTKTNKKFDVETFSSLNGFGENNEQYSFAGNHVKKILEEYKKINVYRILSDSTIGDCIIFYLDETRCLIYCPDVENVKSKYWRPLLTKETAIEDKWYLVSRKS